MQAVLNTSRLVRSIALDGGASRGNVGIEHAAGRAIIDVYAAVWVVLRLPSIFRFVVPYSRRLSSLVTAADLSCTHAGKT